MNQEMTEQIAETKKLVNAVEWREKILSCQESGKTVTAWCEENGISQSTDPKTDGSWCRAFDMELGEVYGCPHDVGWAAACSESGWTDAEILMGLMLPDFLDKTVWGEA